MANNIADSVLNIYAQEAFHALQSNLGLSATVYRDYENSNAEKGDTISIDVPSSFVAGEVVGGSDDNDITTSKIDISLSNWEGVKFSISDKDLQEVRDNFIQNHIVPAGHAVAQSIEEDLFAEFKNVPWFRNRQSTDVPITDIIQCRKILKDNNVPNDPNSFLTLSTERYAALLTQATIINANSSSDSGATQNTGVRSTPFAGLNIWESQNTPVFASGSLSATDPLLKGAATKGATSLIMDKATLTGTVAAGDIFKITGNDQQYAVTTAATAASNEVAVSFTPALVQNYTDNAQITVYQESTYTNINIAYHKSAFALVVRPLPSVPNSAVITDQSSGLSLRVHSWYESETAKNWVRVDALWGLKTLDPNRAVRYQSS